MTRLTRSEVARRRPSEVESREIDDMTVGTRGDLPEGNRGRTARRPTWLCGGETRLGSFSVPPHRVHGLMRRDVRVLLVGDG